MDQRIGDQGQGKDADHRVAFGMLLGMTMGVVLGPALGTLVDNMVAGLAVGTGIGGSISATIGTVLLEPARRPWAREILLLAAPLLAGVATFLLLAMVYARL